MTATVLPGVPTPFPPYTLRLPEGDVIPLVCDSPHSGVLYPDDFGYALPFEQLRSGEDTDVHVLWQALPSVGATLLAARFPRAYIDPNRDLEDIDPRRQARAGDEPSRGRHRLRDRLPDAFPVRDILGSHDPWRVASLHQGIP